MKQKLSILSVILMAVAFPHSARAYDFSAVSPTGHTLYYNIVDGEAQVTYSISPTDYEFYNYNYSNIVGSLIIPNSVSFNGNTYAVASIDNFAFAYCPGITSVTIPVSVTYIGSGAFFECSGLASVVFNADSCTTGEPWYDYSFPTYGEDAYVFAHCNSITSFTFGNTVRVIPDNICLGLSSLTSVTIPNSVTSIGRTAFAGCYSLTEVEIPTSVISIGEEAFASCGLVTLDIPNSITSISTGAFTWCENLATVNIPNSVASIGDGTFSNCGLTTLSIPSSVTSIGEGAFSYCNNLTSVTIPSNVTSIGDYAFYACDGLETIVFNPDSCVSGNCVFCDCYNITSFTFGEGITTIPTSICAGLSGLTSVTIPNSVTVIGGDAFYGCSGLTSVTIPNSVTVIGERAFSECSGLTSVTIPSSVDSIGNRAFSECSSMTSVSFNADSCRYAGSLYGIYSNNLVFDNCNNISSFILGDNVKAIPDYICYGLSSLTSVTIPPAVTNIGVGAFVNTGLTSVVFNADSCTVSSSPFYESNNLTSFTFGNNVKVIPDYICSGRPLTSITIPDSVKIIGNYAFSGCSDLGSITIPASVDSIGNQAFSNCGGLISVLFNAKNAKASCPDLYSPFKNCDNIASFTFGDSVRTIPAFICSRLTNLPSVTISSSVTNIERWAFNDCSGLTSVNIPNSVDKIENHAFQNCSGLTSLTIPSSIDSIGDCAFKDCSGLTSVVFNADSCIYTGEGGNKSVFLNCNNINSFTFGNNVKIIPPCLCYGLNSITSITIPNSVTRIEYSAFYGIGITSVTIPANIAYIGASAFNFCPLMEINYNATNASGYMPVFIPYKVVNSDTVFATESHTLNIGANVRSIPNYIFSNMLITSVVLPDSLETIGEFSFYKTPLNSIVIPDMVTTIGRRAFSPYALWYSGVDETSTLHRVTIGASVISIGEYAFAGITNPDTMFVRTEVPPTCYQAFYLMPENTTIVVPCGTLEDYQESNYWNNFTNIREVSCNTFITAVSNNAEYGSVSGGGDYSVGDTILLLAMPHNGYSFTGWADGSTDNPRLVLVTRDTTYTANFTPAMVEPIHDTTYINIHDTAYIDVFVHDTIIVMQVDTLVLTDTVTLVDTLTLVDTVTLTEYVPVHDTTYIDAPYAVHDTTIVMLTDTVTITEYVPVHDTTIVTMTDTVTLTEYVTVHDTTVVTLTDTITNMVYDTVTNTVFDTIVNTIFDTVDNFIYDTTIVTDTLWLTLYDTVWMTDTVYIHDTVYVPEDGIDGVATTNIRLYQRDGQIVVEDADGGVLPEVVVYDAVGRKMETALAGGAPAYQFDVPASGVYLVKIGDRPARRIVVIR